MSIDKLIDRMSNRTTRRACLTSLLATALAAVSLPTSGVRQATADSKPKAQKIEDWLETNHEPLAEQPADEEPVASDPAAEPAQDRPAQDGNVVISGMKVERRLPKLDGRTPLSGLDSTYGKPGLFPLKAELTSTEATRSADLYAAVIAQFGVETNPRYKRDAYTYCNAFAGDVARAMGVAFPTKSEFLGQTGDLATIGAADLYRWFTRQSARQGWREVDPGEADGLRQLIDWVNAGKPAFGTDPGHVVVVRPGQTAKSVSDLRIAQAGARNVNDVRLGEITAGDGFSPRFFIHS